LKKKSDQGIPRSLLVAMLVRGVKRGQDGEINQTRVKNAAAVQAEKGLGRLYFSVRAEKRKGVPDRVNGDMSVLRVLLGCL